MSVIRHALAAAALSWDFDTTQEFQEIPGGIRAVHAGGQGAVESCGAWEEAGAEDDFAGTGDAEGGDDAGAGDRGRADEPEVARRSVARPGPRVTRPGVTQTSETQEAGTREEGTRQGRTQPGVTMPGARLVRASREQLEALLRAKKLDGTLASADREDEAARAGRLVPTSWPDIDARLGGGFPRGECSEIVGARSTGRTSVLCALLAAAAARGDIVALVDACDRFDPVSAAGLGLDLDRLLWVRGFSPEPSPVVSTSRAADARPVSETTPSGHGAASRHGAPAGVRDARVSREAMAMAGRRARGTPSTASGGTASASAVSTAGRSSTGGMGRMTRASSERQAAARAREDMERQARRLERAIKAFGLILQAGGFGVVALDLADVPLPALRQLPFTTWRRLQRWLEGSETVGLLLAAEPLGRSARGVTLRLSAAEDGTHLIWTGENDRARLFAGFAFHPHVHSARRIGDATGAARTTAPAADAPDAPLIHTGTRG